MGGFVDGGGGICVSATDTICEQGLRMPRFTAETERKLGTFLGSIVNILHNPVDVSQHNRNPGVLKDVVKCILDDRNIDLLMVQEDMGILTKLCQCKILLP